MSRLDIDLEPVFLRLLLLIEEAVVVLLFEDVAPVEDSLGFEQAGDKPYVAVRLHLVEVL